MEKKRKESIEKKIKAEERKLEKGKGNEWVRKG